jgi:hypothetical protein
MIYFALYIKFFPTQPIEIHGDPLKNPQYLCLSVLYVDIQQVFDSQRPM